MNGVSTNVGELLLQAPIAINWNYSYRCNMNCLHCYSRERSTEDEISEEAKLQVTENIIRNQVFYVSFGGGECLLDPQLPVVIETLSKAGVFTTLSTNGWRIPMPLLCCLKESGLDQLVVSLDFSVAVEHDAQRGVTGSFEEVLHCLSICQELQMRTMLSTVITRENFAQLENLIALANEHRCAGMDLKRLRLVGNAAKHPELLLTKTEEQELFENMVRWKRMYPLELNLSYFFQPTPGIDDGCPSGKRLLTILSNGDISACAYRPQVLGNAVRDDIGTIWRDHDLLSQMRNSCHCVGDTI